MKKGITDLSQYVGKAIMLTNQESQVSNKFYRSQVVVIPIDISMFHDMKQGNYYPNKGPTNTIAHGSGIEFLPNIRMREVYGDETVHADGSKTRKVAGKECIKQGRKMKPDGTWATSSPCTYEFNFMDRAESEILKAEEKYGPQTTLQKKKKILELKKFSSQRASTGAELIVARELLGAKTAFKKDEISFGQIVVSRIEKTEDFQEALAHAEVENTRNGGLIANRIDNTALQLTGETIDSSAEFNDYFQKPEKSEQSGNSEPSKQSENTDQGFKTEPLKPETPKERYERFCEENNISDMPDDWRGQLDPTLEQQNFSKESVDWAIGEMKARL